MPSKKGISSNCPKLFSNIIQTEICVFENGSNDTVNIAWSPCVVRMRYGFVYIYKFILNT